MTTPNLFTRDDTFLGVCAAIGEDFGFNPTWLRILFGVSVLAAPFGAMLAYLGLAVIVLASRLAAPARRPESKAKPVALAAPLQADNAETDLPLAA